MTNAFEAALAKSLRKLKSSDRFESEIRSSLAEYDPEIVEQVLAKLKAMRVLNDRRTIQAALDQNRGKQLRSVELLRQKLMSRGAPETLLNEMLTSANAHSDTLEPVIELLSRKFDPQRPERAKAGRFLFSRGFGEEAIEDALDRFFGAETARSSA